MREGETVKYLKRGWNSKEGKGNKNLKKRGQAGLRGGVLKRGGGNPLQTMPIKIYFNDQLKLYQGKQTTKTVYLSSPRSK